MKINSDHTKLKGNYYGAESTLDVTLGLSKR